MNSTIIGGLWLSLGAVGFCMVIYGVWLMNLAKWRERKMRRLRPDTPPKSIWDGANNEMIVFDEPPKREPAVFEKDYKPPPKFYKADKEVEDIHRGADFESMREAVWHGNNAAWNVGKYLENGAPLPAELEQMRQAALEDKSDAPDED